MPRVVLAILCAASLSLACSTFARGQGPQYGSAPPFDAAAYVQPGEVPAAADAPRPWSRVQTAGGVTTEVPPGSITPTSATIPSTTAPPRVLPTASRFPGHATAAASNAGRELSNTPQGRTAVAATADPTRRASTGAERLPPANFGDVHAPPQAIVQPASYRAAAAASTPQTSPARQAISPRNLPPAGEDHGQPNDESSPPLNAARSLATMASGLAVVLGLFLVAVWLWRKRMPQAIMPLPGGVLEVLGRSNLGGKHRLHLVRLGNKLLLVSTTADCAETLTEIDDPDEVTRLMGLCLQGRPGSSSRAFRDVLTELAQDGLTGRHDSRSAGVPDERATLQAALRRAREANLG